MLNVLNAMYFSYAILTAINARPHLENLFLSVMLRYKYIVRRRGRVRREAEEGGRGIKPPLGI